MSINYKSEIKNWVAFFLTIMTAVWIHEIGHCIPAWLHGYAAIPTPAQEYILHPVSVDLNQQISLGGYVGTVSFALVVLHVFLFTTFKYKSAIFAGVATVPGFYCILFLLSGRGHGGHEFQEAQAALGFSYSGHFLDMFFIVLLSSLAIIWFVMTKPGYKIIRRLLIGAVVSFFFLMALEMTNNAIFDPVFQATAFIRN